MPTIEEIRRATLERDHLLQVNVPLPGWSPITLAAPPANAWQNGQILGVAERGHRERGCNAPEAWCPFCELLSITKR
jgi:hypothetical protein